MKIKTPWLMNKTRRPGDVFDSEANPDPRVEPPVPESVIDHEQEEPPHPEPEHTPNPASTPTTGRRWLTPTRIMVAAAVVPSLLSLVWLATTVAEIAAGPNGEVTAAGLATGVFADVLIISTVAVGWFVPSVRTQAGIGGWVAATAAGLLLGWHYWGSEQVVFAAVPVAAKFLWHLALTARTNAETEKDRRAAAQADQERREREQAQREAEEVEARQAADAGADDASLTVEQRRQIADLRREAAFAKAKADAEAEQARAQIDAENTVAMATDQAEADRLRTRYELAAQVGGRLPIQVLAQFLPELPGVEVTEIQHGNEHSQLEAIPAPDKKAEATPAGFGAALSEARHGTGEIEADLAGHPSSQVRASSATVGGGTDGTEHRRAHHAARRAAGQATRKRVLEAIREHGVRVSNNELADLLGLGRTTVRDHRKALAKAGERVWPDR